MRRGKKKTEKKTEYVTRAGMTVLTAILIALFLWIMILVGKIQGTARVVNYAGLVRGETQRMIKLENAGYPQDRMSETIHSYIKGLREGSDELNFVRLDDADFQDKMKELDDYFQILKEEVSLVREKGYQQTDIIEKSEKFFRICDKAVGRAEVYSQRLATALDHLERVVIVDIAGLLILIGSTFSAKGEQQLSYIIVLGAQMKPNGPSVVLEKRLRRAYTYLTENPETLCVLSGGRGSNEPVSEAQGMYDDLVKKGIDPKRLILEDQSTNTVENLRFSRKLIPQEVQKVGIVTSNFHVYRSLRLAKQQGFLDAVGISADSGVYFLPNNLLRECFGIVKDRLYGNLKFF